MVRDMSVRPLCVITWPGFDRSDSEIRATLEGVGLELSFHPKTGHRTQAEVVNLMRRATAGIVSTDPFDASVLSQCHALQILARVASGWIRSM